MSKFVKNSSLKTWSLTIDFDPQEMPAIVGWRDDKSDLLTEAVVETDRLDGSAFDSDGIEKEFNLTADYQAGKLIFTTLEDDEDFWVGTEENCSRIGMLGYYSDIIEESLQTINEHKEIDAMAVRDDQGVRQHPEVFVWARSYAQEHAPGLLDTPRSAPRP